MEMVNGDGQWRWSMEVVIGKWKMETCAWRMENVKWKMENVKCI